MMSPNNRWRFAPGLLVALALLGLAPERAMAYDSYDDCQSCHGGFVGGFGAPLHDLHLTFVGACTDCHVIPGDVPKIGLNAAGTTGCVGCHGREADDVGQFFGGLGTGLRAHHAAEGETSCATCHGDDPVPVGEDVFPPFYAALGLDPATDNLDNDGDLLYDAADPDFGNNENLPPNVDAGGPYTGFVGEPVMFDGSNTSDPEGDVLVYLWDFGDGSTPPFPSSAMESHIYDAAGEYTATLAVTDGENFPVLAEVAVTIFEMNLPPLVDPGGPYSGEVDEPVTLDASNTVDPDGDMLFYSWDFGDGGLPTLPSPIPTATHTYDAAGEYTARVTVMDGVNAPVTEEVPVTITDIPPPPEGDVWTLIHPYTGDVQTLEFEPFAGILLVQMTHANGAQANGASSFGIGMEMGRFIFWMDVTGAIYYGNIDRTMGVMSGIVFGGRGAGGIWFAETL